MAQRTVDRSALGPASGSSGPSGSGSPSTSAPEGLRERKKRETRQRLTDTATEMFLARGFDAVRVSEIADACGVSEKTVFNYFPTKESLVLDRFETAPEALATALADTTTPPVEAVLRMLTAELAALTGWMAAQPDFATAARQVARFGELIASTPSLRAHQRDTLDRLTAQAAEALASRAGTSTAGIEASVAANALLGLWPAQYAALGRHLTTATDAAGLFDMVTAEVRLAGMVVRDGLGAWIKADARPAGV